MPKFNYVSQDLSGTIEARDVVQATTLAVDLVVAAVDGRKLGCHFSFYSGKIIASIGMPTGARKVLVTTA